MYAITNGKSKVTCDNCKKTTLVVENAGSRPRKTRQAVKAAGWVWLGTKAQLCPNCKGKASEFKAKSKEGTKKASPSGKKTVKEPRKPITLVGRGAFKKANGGGEPPVGGQSIGRLARSAKVPAHPPAE